MPKTLKNRRNKRSKTQRGGVLGLSSTILAMRSFDKEDFKTVYNYLRGETGASRFNGFPKNVNNSKKGPPDSILNFDRFKELYLYFKNQEKVAHDRAIGAALFSGKDPNTTDWDVAAKVVIRFKNVVDEISKAKKRGDRLNYTPRPTTTAP
jgi:hypothetical protein